MAVPERKGHRAAWLGAGVVVALLAVAALVVCVVTVDGRRRQQLADLEERLDTLGRLVEDMQGQLDRHVNSSHQIKNSAEGKVPQQDIVYEDQYEYDDEEDSDDYDEEDEYEDSHKATVKRTTVLSEDNTNNTEVAKRSRRDISAVMEQRYVPTNHIEHSQNKHGELRMYETYFGNPLKRVTSSDLPHHSQSSQTEEDNVQIQDTKSHHRPHPNSHQPHTPVYQNQRRPEESFVRLRHGGRSRNKNTRVGDVEFISGVREELEPELTEDHQNYNIIAAHFVGDVSAYNSRVHSHYYGNHIMHHPSGIFKDWVPASWMFELGTKSHFTVHHGKLSVEKSGIYFIYAQIYYMAMHDRCGFHIKRNGEEVAQCMITSIGGMFKRNTCFTALILQLQTSDLLWTSEIEGHRNTSFKNSHSFFGLILLKPN